MALATDRHIGDDELVYVATTAPTVLSSRVDTAYKVLGLQASFAYSSQAQSTEIRDKQGVATKYGANARTATLAANTSLVGDDGQTIMNNAAEAVPKTEIYVLITSGITGQRFRHFRATVGGVNDTSPVNAAATVEYTLGVTTVPVVGTLV